MEKLNAIELTIVAGLAKRSKAGDKVGLRIDCRIQSKRDPSVDLWCDITITNGQRQTMRKQQADFYHAIDSKILPTVNAKAPQSPALTDSVTHKQEKYNTCR